MAAPMNKVDYLKRYMSSTDDKEKVKKKRKKIKVAVKMPRSRIIDDDVDLNALLPENLTNTLEEDVGDEDPTVAEVIDERPDHVKQLEQFEQSDKWRKLGQDNSRVGSSHLQDSHSDQSPLRRSYTRHDSDSDQSPPRNNTTQRHDSDSDQSPPRKTKSRHDSDSDQSPPRKRTSKRHDSDSDQSPPRKTKTMHDLDSDQSPPRKGTSKRHDSDSDQSPPRKKTSKRQDSDSDQSPPRKRSSNRQDSNSDQSPPRKTKTRHDSDSDQSPPRKSKAKSNEKRQRKSRFHDIDSNPSPPRQLSKNEKTDVRPHKTLGGATAGLSSAKQMREEAVKLRRKEDDMFNQIDDETLGRNAKTVFRKGGRIAKMKEKEKTEEEIAKEKEMNEKYKQWGKGLKQVSMNEATLADHMHEMAKPLARYKDDEDLDSMLKNQDREGDPMLAFMKKKKAKAGVKEKPKYKGPAPPPNRFGIMPGYRWDGVDRSNGFEKALYAQRNNKKATADMAYKWSVEDM